MGHARTAVTVNSTAAQQVLHRGIPLKVFGKAVYAKPEFVSDLSVEKFFTRPARPDNRAFKDYRCYLLETSQVPGGFYSARGRRQLMRQVVDMMLDKRDPYDALRAGKAPPRQQLRVVKYKTQHLGGAVAHTPHQRHRASKDWILPTDSRSLHTKGEVDTNPPAQKPRQF